MTTPTPPVALDGHCSAIRNDTLYTFQWNAFQSLPLVDGGSWSQLPMGVPVNGSRCVAGTANGQDALWIVGGVADQSNSSYPGLQRYLFDSQRWENVQLGESVMRNRQSHGAAYLEASSSILVYAGSQNSSGVAQSSQTFTVSANDPAALVAYTSNAPPVSNPLMMPWNATHAVMIGGDSKNRAIWIFSTDSGWQPLAAAITPGVGNASSVQAAVVQGANGSKALQLFDLSKSPNQVYSLIIDSGDSQPSVSKAVKATVIGRSVRRHKRSARLRKRQVDFSTWPTYSDALAPKTIRKNFSLAQSPSGLTVMSGGTKNSDDDSLTVFNQTGNSWVDSTKFFGNSNPSRVGSPSSTASPSSSSAAAATSAAPTSSSSSSPVSPAISSSSSGPDTRTIIGAVLGGVFGLAAILIILLLILRYKRIKKQNEASDAIRIHEEDMAFATAGAAVGLATTRAVSPNAPAEAKRGFPGVSGMPISNPTLVSDSSSPENLNTFPGVFANSGQSAAITGNATQGDDGGLSQYLANNQTSEVDALGLASGAVVGAAIGAGAGAASASTPGPEATKSSPEATLQTQLQYEPVSAEFAHPSAKVPPLNYTPYRVSQVETPQGPLIVQTPGKAPLTAPITSSDEPEIFLDANGSSSGVRSWDPIANITGSSQITVDPTPPSSVYADIHPSQRPNLQTLPAIPTLPVIPITPHGLGNSWQQGTQSNSDSRGLRTTAARDLTGGAKAQTPATAEAKKTTSEDMSWLRLGVDGAQQG